MKIILILILVCCASLTTQAYANTVGIIIETSALKSGKISYRDLIPFDNSNQQISGKFIEKNGLYERECSKVHNNIAYYNYAKNNTVLVDPCMTQRNSIPTITIMSKLDAFFAPGQRQTKEILPSYTIQNGTIIKAYKAIDFERHWSHTMYVDPKCNDIRLSVKDWENNLPQVITYLQSGCNGVISFNTTSKEVLPIVKHDIKTSYKWKYDDYINQIKQCGKTKGGCKDMVQPTRGGSESKIPANYILNKTRNH